jgi:hypothetical protein
MVVGKFKGIVTV